MREDYGLVYSPVSTAIVIALCVYRGVGLVLIQESATVFFWCDTVLLEIHDKLAKLKFYHCRRNRARAVICI